MDLSIDPFALGERWERENVHVTLFQTPPFPLWQREEVCKQQIQEKEVEKRSSK